MIHPVVLVVFAVIIVSFLLATAENFKTVEPIIQRGQELPTNSIFIGIEHLSKIGASNYCCWSLAWLCWLRPRSKDWACVCWDRKLLSIPLIGKIVAQCHLSLCTHTFNLFLKCDSNFEGMKVADAAFREPPRQTVMIQASDSVREGASLVKRLIILSSSPGRWCCIWLPAVSRVVN